MSFQNVVDIADRAGPFLLAANIIMAAIALWFFTRTRDGRPRVALIAIMATIVLTFSLSLVQSLMRQAGMDLGAVYVTLFVTRLITLAALVWLVTLLVRRDGR